MKKIVSFTLGIIMIITSLFTVSITALADGSGNCGTNGGNVTWQLTGSTLYINKGTGDDIRMTNFVNNGASRPGWYSSRNSITKVVIEEGVVNIGSYAFDDCSKLTEVDFGTIDTIGNHAFHNCTSLTSVSLPSSFCWMYSAVFDGCTGLKSAYLGERLWTEGNVPDYFFNNCTSLRVIRMGSKFTGFGEGALNNCTSLKVIISDNENLSYDGVTIAPTSALDGICSENTYSETNLTYSFDMNNFTLSFTGSGNMKGVPWENLKPVIDTVSFAGTDAKTSIDTSAFELCTNLTSVNLKNVYSIGWGAFGRCYKLGSVDFDSKLSEIWDYAFSECTSLDHAVFNEGTQDLHIRHHAFNLCTGTTYWLNLPANTKYVDDYAFWGTNFNYIHVYSTDAVYGTDAFGNGKGGYARFFGVAGTHTTLYDYVQAYKTDPHRRYGWHYYCMGDSSAHQFTTTVVAPTCTEEGYDLYGCIYCEEGEYKSNYKAALDHNYIYTHTSGANFIYRCPRCSRTDLTLSAFDTMFKFSDALSDDSDDPYFDASYNGKFDIDNNGIINGRDWALMTKQVEKIDTTNKETTINTSTTYQTIEGWGASGAWWAQEVGEWENTKDVLRLLYSRNDGIGLNIFRYNLGAGSRNSDPAYNDTAMGNEGTRTNCFLQSDGTYDWSADDGAMNSLYWANKYCPNVKVQLFSNSAPVYYTKNHKSYGSSSSCNLSSDNFGNFADFVVTCAEHFIDEGYNVTEISPINEPEWGWDGSGQEGCHFDPTEARAFYNDAMIPKMNASSKLGNVELAVWECAQLNHSWWWNGFLDENFSSVNGKEEKTDNKNIRENVHVLDTHSYWVSADDRRAVMSQLSNSKYSTISKIKCSEYCQMYNDGNSGVVGHTQAAGGTSNGMDIDYGLAMADIIYQDMTILNAVEWDWWTACGKGIYTDSLVYVDANDHSNIQTAKRLWCLGNYSKFIQVGAKRIEVTTGSAFGKNLTTRSENIYEWIDLANNASGYDKYNYLEESAYLNPDGSVAIVYINNSDTVEYTSVANNGYSDFKSYVTDSEKNLELYQSGDTSEPVCIPARSCTTVVLKNAMPAKSREGAYLFSYFTGNSTSQQRVHFAVSKDGYHFTPLNNNDEIITQTKGTLNCRDPYIFKGQDGYYYIIATDMDCNTGWWGNSNSMVLWRSTDLVNWTDETIINMAEITGAWIGRCWAPQVIWDENEQKYFVYFALYRNDDDYGTEMYYCYTDNLLDQSSYSNPKEFYTPASGKDAIDGDIIYDSKNGIYYLYYKDEDNATICYVTSTSLTGPYSDASNPQKVLDSNVALEGCNAYFINGTDTLVMLADAYLDGYFVLNRSNDFKHFTTLDNSESTINATQPRHGSVISISDEEYDRLVDAYGLL